MLIESHRLDATTKLAVILALNVGFGLEILVEVSQDNTEYVGGPHEACRKIDTEQFVSGEGS